MNSTNSTYSKPLPLSQTFQLLASLLHVDPEDLDAEERDRIFQQALKEFDYWYDRSDDLRVYDKGQMEYNIILEHTSRDKELYEIWKAFCAEKDKR